MAVFLIQSATSQTTIIIQGYVTNLNSVPIPGKPVQLYVDSVFVPILFSWTSVAYTDSAGFYSDTVNIPVTIGFAQIMAAVVDCNNLVHNNYSWYPGNAMMNFIICDSVNIACGAYFHASSATNSLQVNFTDMSVPSTGSTLSTWQWDFGDGNSSTLQNPSHTYVQSGMYNVCLTITDNTNCSSTWCYPVQVSSSIPGLCSANFSYSAIPGTMQVSFNNQSFTNYMPAIYTIEFEWNFGDNNTSTQFNPHHVYSQAGTYQVCLTIMVREISTQQIVCQDTYCDVVSIGQASGYLYGTLTSNSGAAGPSIVYLIEHDMINGTLTAVDTTWSVDSAGITAYYFPNIQPGNYLVKAALLPSNPNYSSNMPTYHQSALFWNQASNVHVLPNTITQASINFIQGINPGGPGFVGGQISQGANKSNSDPVEGVVVLLLDVNNGDQPVAWRVSDASGMFGFNDIPYGTYKVFAEMYSKTTHPVIVTIDANTPSVDDLRIFVGEHVISSIIEQPKVISNIGNLFPNPAKNSCFIQFNSERIISGSIEIYDICGKKVKDEQYKVLPGFNLLEIDTKALDNGVYFVSISFDDGTSISRKLVVR